MKKVLMLALTASVLLGACKKDKEDSNPANRCQILKFTPAGNLDYSPTEHTITYNTNGKIAGIYNAEQSRIFSYESDKMTVGVDANLLLTYNYNSSKQIISAKSSSQWPENVTISYNDSKISKILTSVDDISSTFTYSNNEVVKIIEKWGDRESFETIITYKDEKYTNPLIFELTFPSMIDGAIRSFIKYNLADSFGGKEKRLIDKVEYIGKNGWNSYTNTYSYLKDDKGNITKISIITTTGIGYTSGTFTLEYNCN